MSADVLRRASALMRERAEAATDGPWHPYFSEVRESTGFVVGVVGQTYANAPHIASWHPAVALAVADWLDDVAERTRGTSQARLERDAEEREWYMPALTVARAYLGEVEA